MSSQRQFSCFEFLSPYLHSLLLLVDAVPSLRQAIPLFFFFLVLFSLLLFSQLLFASSCIFPTRQPSACRSAALAIWTADVHIDVGMDVGMVADLGHNRPKAVLGDSAVFLRPANIDGMNLEPARESVVGESHC